MKKALLLFLIFCLLFTGCAQSLSISDPKPPLAGHSSAEKSVSQNANVTKTSTPSDFVSVHSQASVESNPSKTDDTQSESRFWIRFLDVGQADSALVMCGGKYMLIDGGNVADSSLVFSCLKAQGVETLDYIICTHGHEDHVGGLSGALNACGAKTVLSSCKTYDSDAFRDFSKYVEQADAQIKIPEAGSEYAFGDASFTVLSPSRRYEDENNNSVVLRLTYGETSFLFMGDAEREAELDILNSGYTLKSDLIKIGHHGSETSTSYVFLREVMPEYAVISVGKDNSYGHPDETVLSRLNDAGVTVFRTDQSGDILVESDGEKLSISAPKNTAPASSRTASSEQTVSAAQTGEYIGNINSKVVHLASCGSLPNPENRAYFATLEEALRQNYRPCGNCHPDAGSPNQTVSVFASSVGAASVNTGQDSLIGNKNTKKVHLPSCSFLPDEQNRAFFQTYQAAVNAGYEACQKCHPDRG